MTSSNIETTKLEHLVEIYIPTESRCGELLSADLREEVLDEVKTSFCNWFGGSTIDDRPVEGSWTLDHGDLAKEKVDVLFSHTDSSEALEDHFEDLQKLAAKVAYVLNQEKVAFRIKGEMVLVPAVKPRSLQAIRAVSLSSLPPEMKADERHRLMSLQAALQRLKSLRDIRSLFCNVLHYEYADELMPLVHWSDKLKEAISKSSPPRVIADQNDFKILYIQSSGALKKGTERQIVDRIISDNLSFRGLFVFSDVEQKNWHLVNPDYTETEEGKRGRLRLRRMTVGLETAQRTAVERLGRIDIDLIGEDATAAELQDIHDEAFDVESVSQEFFNEISNWYFWALPQVDFPKDTVSSSEEEKHRATSLIRFLTRIIFCWFLKEKGLIPDSLFKRKELEDILVDLEDDHCTYHQGILQNLFFATLNQRMGKDKKGQPYRRFVTDSDFQGKNKEHGITDLYRYPEHFSNPEKAPAFFQEIPFLNGGLFECLDREDPNNKNRMLRVDGFTAKGTRAQIPNKLFFAGEHQADLSGKEAFGNAKYKKARVRGLLNILHAYNFTVEENTPVDEEIALDPELLGKVFENLLASYDEDSKKSARKATGSFYTPRAIVEYMVDESLKLHLIRPLVEAGRDNSSANLLLTSLLDYESQETEFSESEKELLLNNIHSCKILDPACGSGAFPMGMLQKLLHIVQKLDDKNEIFERIQIEEAQKITDRDERLKKIEKIGRDFAENNVDYARKLYLIENCLYGVDIQPIAIQISKLRFFISLICDQKTNKDKAKNHGVEALPNLETKIVAANTLISIPDFGSQDLFLETFTKPIEQKIEEAYHRYFSVQRRDIKLRIQNELKVLREQLGNEILNNIGAKESAGITEKARSIANWNPFDAQTSSDFFDARWMFGESLHGGFNIVIGNPPYGGTKISDELKKELNLGSKDIYGAFISKAFQKHLAPNGLLSFIVSDTFMTIKTHRPLREQILNHKVHKMIRVHPDTFKATVNTAIIILEKHGSIGSSSDEQSHVCLMADLTNVSIHENFQRFVELLHRTLEDRDTGKREDQSLHFMEGQEWWSESSSEYAMYSYPQRLIRTNSNIPFFLASPKLFRLMNDTTNSVEFIEIDGAKVPVRTIPINFKNVEITKLGDMAEVKQGLATGDNDAYLFQNPEARGNYRSIIDSQDYLLRENDLEKIRKDENLRLAVIEKGISKNDSNSKRFFDGRYIIPYDKGGESDAEGGWMPNYWVSTNYFIDWSEEALNRMKTYTIAQRIRDKGESKQIKPHYESTTCAVFRSPNLYFKKSLSFSRTGVYAPTFRLGAVSSFDTEGSMIFLPPSININSGIGLLASNAVKFLCKNFLGHTVHCQVDELKEIIIPVNGLEVISELVKNIVRKQKSDFRYNYAINEQLEIDRIVYEAYGLNDDDIREVENWYARRYPSLAAAQRANKAK